MIMVVGDIIGFSTIAETTGDRALLENIDRLYAGLRQILARHDGTLSNYVGDAFFATWEAAVPDDATVDMATFDRAVPTGPPATGLPRAVTLWTQHVRPSPLRWRRPRPYRGSRPAWTCATPGAARCGWAGASPSGPRRSAS